MRKDIKILFMGTPKFALNVLEGLNKEYSVIGVVTNIDKRGKRGNELIFSPVKEYCLSNNIPMYQKENIKTDYEDLLSLSYDYIVTAAFGQFIPKQIIASPKIDIINVHGSILPKYRGGAPIQRAIMACDSETGVSIMRTKSKMDSGEVFKIVKTPIYDTDTYESLSERLSLLGRDAVIDVINNYESYKANESVQDEEKVSIARIIEKEECLIDFSLSVDKVSAHIRGLFPDPMAYFVFNGLRYQIMSHDVDKYSDAIPGRILRDNKTLKIECINGCINIKEIKEQGKKQMLVKDFLNGNKTFINLTNIA